MGLVALGSCRALSTVGNMLMGSSLSIRNSTYMGAKASLM
jgi:hypothetical protein